MQNDGYMDGGSASLIIAIVIIIQLVTRALCAYVTDEKGRGAAGWFIIGLLTGPLGLLAIAGLPVRASAD